MISHPTFVVRGYAGADWTVDLKGFCCVTEAGSVVSWHALALKPACHCRRHGSLTIEPVDHGSTRRVFVGYIPRSSKKLSCSVRANTLFWNEEKPTDDGGSAPKRRIVCAWMQKIGTSSSFDVTCTDCNGRSNRLHSSFLRKLEIRWVTASILENALNSPCQPRDRCRCQPRCRMTDFLLCTTESLGLWSLVSP